MFIYWRNTQTSLICWHGSGFFRSSKKKSCGINIYTCTAVYHRVQSKLKVTLESKFTGISGEWQKKKSTEGSLGRKKGVERRRLSDKWKSKDWGVGGCRGHVSEREWEIKPVLVGWGLPAAPDSLFRGLGWVASYSHKKSSKMSSKFQSQTIHQKLIYQLCWRKTNTQIQIASLLCLDACSSPCMSAHNIVENCEIMMSSGG